METSLNLKVIRFDILDNVIIYFSPVVKWIVNRFNSCACVKVNTENQSLISK